MAVKYRYQSKAAPRRWNTRPTFHRARQADLAYGVALKLGAGHDLAMKFGGFYADTCAMITPSYFTPVFMRSPDWDETYQIREMYQRSKAKGFKFAHGKNGNNYRLVYLRHLPLMVLGIMDMVWERICQDDLDFVRSLKCSQVYLPFVDIESYDDFKNSVTKAAVEYAASIVA